MPLDPNLYLDFLFAIRDTCTITKVLQIHLNSITYQIVTNRPPQHLIVLEVLIIQDRSGAVSAYLNNHLLTHTITHRQPKLARIVSSKSSVPCSYTPPTDHPWRSYGKKLNG